MQRRNGRGGERAKSPEEGKAAIFCYLFDTYHGPPAVRFRLARASGIWGHSHVTSAQRRGVD